MAVNHMLLLDSAYARKAENTGDRSGLGSAYIYCATEPVLTTRRSQA